MLCEVFNRQSNYKIFLFYKKFEDTKITFGKLKFSFRFTVLYIMKNSCGFEEFEYILGMKGPLSNCEITFRVGDRRLILFS